MDTPVANFRNTVARLAGSAFDIAQRHPTELALCGVGITVWLLDAGETIRAMWDSGILGSTFRHLPLYFISTLSLMKIINEEKGRDADEPVRAAFALESEGGLQRSEGDDDGGQAGS
jgi:hypothetical protein